MLEGLAACEGFTSLWFHSPWSVPPILQLTTARPPPKYPMVHTHNREWKKQHFVSGKAPLGLSKYEKVTVWELNKGFVKRTKMDFMSIRNDSYKTWMSIFLERRSMEISHEFWCVWSVQYKHLNMNAQSCIRTSSPAIRQWCGKPATSEPDSTVWTYHTSIIWP